VAAEIEIDQMNGNIKSIKTDIFSLNDVMEMLSKET